MKNASVDFKGKNVLIMGLGLLGGGIGATRFFVKKGADITVTDLKTKEQLAPALLKLKGLPVRYVLGGHKKEDFTHGDLIVRNPDVLFSSPYLAIARRHGIPIEMVESFFAKHTKAQIIGVTGTRGKSTTASMIGKLLDDAHIPAVLGGNIAGSSTLELLDSVSANTYVVLELSSFQLHGFGESKISPHITVVTNIFPEHLNHYNTMREYIDDKKNIFRYQRSNDFLILNKNDTYTKEFKREAKSHVTLFDKQDVPRDWHLQVLGNHNLENAAAAMAVGRLLNVNKANIKTSLTSFMPLPYRLQKIRELDGVTFINDGVSSSPEATIAAIESLNKPLLLLLGGNDKLLDFRKLGEMVDKKAKAVFLMKGTATEKMERAITQNNLIKGAFDTLADTVTAAYQYGKSGDIVLFSPAATSFNWFNNVYERSAAFEKLVKDLSS